MSDLFPESAIAFLRDLDANNNKEWFQANKKRYEKELKAPSRALAEAVNQELKSISPNHALEQSHKAINRINRDIRFSKDKTPYNTKVWAGFHDKSVPKGSSAGFYFGITLDSCGIGCGAWMPPKPYIGNLRAWIAENHADLTEALAALPSEFGELKGEKYKRVPKLWDAEHPAAELLKHKGMHLGRDYPLELATSDDFVSTVAAQFRAMQPIVALLDAGMQS